MGPPVPVALPAIWVLGCFSLLLWLWALCTACHRKQVQSQQARLQDTVMLAETSLLRQTHLCPLSKSDTRLHELHRGTHGSKGEVTTRRTHGEWLAAAWDHTCCPPLMASGLTLPIALRPASMDLLHPHWLEVSRGSARPLAAPSAFPRQQLPGPPSATAFTLSTGPEATYSNVGLAAIPRASLAASPVVWAGTRLTTGCDRPGHWARPVLAEYASIQKLRGSDPGPQELQQGKTEVTPAAQVDILYSRVCKPRNRDAGPATDPPGREGTGAVLTLETGLTYEPLPPRGLDMDSNPLENVYESIQDVGTPESPEPSILPISISGHM